MNYQAPFYLSGEAGRGLGLESYALGVLGIGDAVLRERSLDVSELEFSLQDNGKRPAIPDDGQWLTLRDDDGRVMMHGICKRSFKYPAMVYSYLVQDAYKGIMETPLRGNDGRPFLIYLEGELGARMRDVLIRAGNAGLPIQPPSAAEMPGFYLAPKMAFRGATFAEALESILKWAPDTVTRMDYSTTPPTLRFATRQAAAETVLDLDADGHKSTELDLTALPEQRALGVSLAYARRDGDNLIVSLEQTAGDPAAEARRTLSVFLSGVERSDALVSDALTTAQLAIIKINELIAVTGAAVDAAAATAQISLTWSAILARDTNLQAAVTAQAGFVMSTSTGQTFELYNGVGWPPGSPWTGTATMPSTAVALRTTGGALATGWWPIVTGAFSPSELATAGATKETRYITGDMYAERGISGNNAGMASVQAAGGSNLTGWLSGYVSDSAEADAQYRKIQKYPLNIPVDAINMSPSAVAAAVKAAAAGTPAAGFIERAEFVEAPAGLAQNYFERQNWTPYKGRMNFTPTAPVVPRPGDFVSVRGERCPVEWATMKVPVSEASTDLQTLATEVTIGPSPRMDFNSLVDRLRIPAEDNYEAG